MTGKFGVLLAAAANGTGSGGFTAQAAPAGVATIFNESDAVTATPDGGTGPYTYSWSMKAGSDPAIKIRDPNSAATTFYCFGFGGEKDGTAVCSVLDTGTGLIATTNDVRIFLLTGGD